MAKRQNNTDTFLDRLDRILRRDRRWLIALFFGSFLLKLAYVLQSSSALHVTVPILDSAHYDTMARQILDGTVVFPDAFFMGPLYPYFLAAIYGTLGKSFLIVRIVQVLGGAITVLLTYMIGRELFRPSVAFLGAVILALYGTVTFYEGQLLMMWLGTIINMTMLAVLVSSWGSEGRLKYIFVGFLMGLSALARANILIFLPVILIWIWLVQRDKARLVKSVLIIVTIVITISPATIHNYLASDDFVPITSNGGINFYIGNSADATGVFFPPQGIINFTDDVIQRYVEKVLGKDVKASEVSAYWFGQSFEFIRENPGKEVALIFRKMFLFFNGYEVPQIESFDLARKQYVTLQVLFVKFWWIFAFAVIGMIYAFRDWRRLFLAYGFVVSFSLSIIIFFVTARYRVQIVPILSLFAAYSLLAVLPTVFSKQRKALVPVVIFLGVLFLTRPSLVALPQDDVLWREHVHHARRYSRAGNVEDAVREINKAIEIHPDYADSYIHRAIIYKEGRNHFKSIDDYSKALKLSPERPTLHYDLAQTLRHVKMYEPAAEEYQLAISLDSTMIQAHNNLGITYRDLKQYERAIQSFEKVLELDPTYTKAYNNLGATYAEAGNQRMAVEVLQKAIQVDPSYANSYKNLAMIHLQMGTVNTAYNMLQRYVTLKPDDNKAVELLQQIRSAVVTDTLR